MDVSMPKLTRILSLSFLGLVLGWLPAAAQVKPSGNTAGSQTLVERGRYIVENVAMCELCHTPRDEHGNPDRGRWLQARCPGLHSSRGTAR